MLLKYLFYILDIVILPFIGFPHFCVINIIQFHFRWNIINFIWKERKLKKLWIQVECLTSFFGLPFWAAFTLSILLPIIPFWSIWTLSQISHFSMLSPVVEWWYAYSTLLFGGSRQDRIILVAGFFRVHLWIVTRYVYS